MDAAYAAAKHIGLTEDRHILQFLYLESVIPKFYETPSVAAWLGKNGLPPEQRFDMMMDVARAKLRDNEEDE